MIGPFNKYCCPTEKAEHEESIIDWLTLQGGKWNPRDLSLVWPKKGIEILGWNSIVDTEVDLGMSLLACHVSVQLFACCIE